MTAVVRILILALASQVGREDDAKEPIIGGPCKRCQYVFDGLPKQLNSRARITADDEPGEPMVIRGVVRDGQSQPIQGIVVYTYQTDASGAYRKGSTPHGPLRAWVQTDEKGRFRFDTIRPAAYPGKKIPQHVHMHVIEPGRATYFVDNVHFEDDPRLTKVWREKQQGRGSNGIVLPRRDDRGVWQVERDIVLGKNVPGYDETAPEAADAATADGAP